MKEIQCRACGKDIIKLSDKISEEVYQLSGLCKVCFIVLQIVDRIKEEG